MSAVPIRSTPRPSAAPRSPAARRCTLALAVLGALAVARAAPAQEPPGRDPASAEVLFEKGKALWKKGDFAEACGKFRASFELDPAASTLVKLARCDERDGKLASALAAYQEAKKRNHASGRPGHREALDRAIDEATRALEPRVPRLVVTAPAAPPGLALRRGEVAIPSAALGEPLPSDPGPTVIVAEAPGHAPFRAELTLAEGERRELVVELRPLPPAPLPEASPPPVLAPTAPTPAAPAGPRPVRPPPALDAPQGPTPLRIGGVALGAAGLASLAVAGGLGIATLVKVGASDDHCDDRDRCDPTGLRLRDEASLLESAGLVAAGAGAALLGVGVALFVAGAPDDTPGPSAHFVVGPHFVGVGGAW